MIKPIFAFIPYLYYFIHIFHPKLLKFYMKIKYCLTYENISIFEDIVFFFSILLQLLYLFEGYNEFLFFKLNY